MAQTHNALYLPYFKPIKCYVLHNTRGKYKKYI